MKSAVACCGAWSPYCAGLDDHAVRDGGVFYHHDDAILNDKAEIFSVALDHTVFIDDLNVAADARILVDDSSSDR